MVQKTILSIENKRIWFDRNIDKAIAEERQRARSQSFATYYNPIRVRILYCACPSFRMEIWEGGSEGSSGVLGMGV